MLFQSLPFKFFFIRINLSISTSHHYFDENTKKWCFIFILWPLKWMNENENWGAKFLVVLAKKFFERTFFIIVALVLFPLSSLCPIPMSMRGRRTSAATAAVIATANNPCVEVLLTCHWNWSIHSNLFQCLIFIWFVIVHSPFKFQISNFK